MHQFIEIEGEGAKHAVLKRLANLVFGLQLLNFVGWQDLRINKGLVQNKEVEPRLYDEGCLILVDRSDFGNAVILENMLQILSV